VSALTRRGTFQSFRRLIGIAKPELEGSKMGFGRGLLLWLLGIPLPIILLLALFWR
jgi:hypothetical protein